jgi:hypothetical protein
MMIAHGHDWDEAGGRPDGLLQLVQADEAVLLYGKVGDLESLGLQLPARVEDALVLRLGSHHVVFLRLVEPGTDVMIF